MSSFNLYHETIKELFSVAKKDGVLTDKERAILDQVTIDVKNYSEALEQALVDGMIDDAETKKLTKLKEKIIKDAKKTANADGELDQDEKDLISKISEVLNKYFG